MSPRTFPLPPSLRRAPHPHPETLSPRASNDGSVVQPTPVRAYSSRSFCAQLESCGAIAVGEVRLRRRYSRIRQRRPSTSIDVGSKHSPSDPSRAVVFPALRLPHSSSRPGIARHRQLAYPAPPMASSPFDLVERTLVGTRKPCATTATIRGEVGNTALRRWACMAGDGSRALQKLKDDIAEGGEAAHARRGTEYGNWRREAGLRRRHPGDGNEWAAVGRAATTGGWGAGRYGRRWTGRRCMDGWL
ncbi:hypothetical protein MKEN_01414300 [Mycena kentingensis (nom. inval.)]|nr:hypothetical protein MKEN_01414300 [Mycena kentingensis (nom. inval.)]